MNVCQLRNQFMLMWNKNILITNVRICQTTWQQHRYRTSSLLRFLTLVSRKIRYVNCDLLLWMRIECPIKSLGKDMYFFLCLFSHFLKVFHLKIFVYALYVQFHLIYNWIFDLSRRPRRGHLFKKSQGASALRL